MIARTRFGGISVIHRVRLGEAHLSQFGLSTEILVKLLDPDQRLPVHGHPNLAFEKEHLALTHGKTEAWIILGPPPEATVGLGFNRDYTKGDALVIPFSACSWELIGATGIVSCPPLSEFAAQAI